MTNTTVHELIEKINSISTKEIRKDSDRLDPLYKAQILIEFITEVTLDNAKESTRHELMCILSDFLEEARRKKQDEVNGV